MTALRGSPASKRCHARAGDKGTTLNLSVIAYRPEDYALLVRLVTAERVKKHFGELVRGEVRRYELPQLRAFNFVLEHALDGGATRSLRVDTLGKTLGAALLRMEI